MSKVYLALYELWNKEGKTISLVFEEIFQRIFFLSFISFTVLSLYGIDLLNKYYRLSEAFFLGAVIVIPILLSYFINRFWLNRHLSLLLAWQNQKNLILGSTKFLFFLYIL